MAANILPATPTPPPYPVTWGRGQNSTFSEHGLVSYQIKEYHKCSNMVANILSAYPLRPLESKVQNSTFSEHGHVAYFVQRGSCMVWEINMGVCPRLDFDNIMLFNCLGYNFNIYGAFEFLCNSIANL